MDALPECASCKTKKEHNASFRLRFSNCCGRSLCDKCISTLFAGRQSQIKCPDCADGFLKRLSFSEFDIERQRWNAERTARANLREVFNFRPTDFPSRAEYDDYLELEQDLIYDTVHGSTEAKKDARLRLQAWKEAHRQQIDSNRERAVREQQYGMMDDSTNIIVTAAAAGASKHAQEFGVARFEHIPWTIALGVLPSDMPPPDQSMEVDVVARSAAGGFVPSHIHSRCSAEATASLFVNMQP